MITIARPGWREYHRPGAPDRYPERWRDEIDELNALVFTDVNNGVYQAGFASSQEAYERAHDALFARLATRRYLVGDHLTEADIRLFTTLVRFDPVYHGHFKCNRHKLAELPVLWAYARDLYQTPGFAGTVAGRTDQRDRYSGGARRWRRTSFVHRLGEFAASSTIGVRGPPRMGSGVVGWSHDRSSVRRCHGLSLRG